MTPADKYRHLEGEALASLRHPLDAAGFAQLVRPSLRLIVWRYPAFEPYQSWALIQEETAEDLWLIRRVTWNRSEDYARAADPIRQAGFMTQTNPSPTLDAVDVRVSVASFVRTFETLDRALRLQTLAITDLPGELRSIESLRYPESEWRHFVEWLAEDGVSKERDDAG